MTLFSAAHAFLTDLLFAENFRWHSTKLVKTEQNIFWPCSSIFLTYTNKDERKLGAGKYSDRRMYLRIPRTREKIKINIE